MKRAMALLAIGAVGVAVPVAVAKPTTKTPPKNCTAKKEAYRASGTVVTWGLTKNTNGTYSGMLEVKVTSTNHHAKTDKHGDVTYTVKDAHVTMAKGVKTPGAGDRVTVKGTITYLPKGCSTTGFTPTVNVTKVSLQAPKKK